MRKLALWLALLLAATLAMPALAERGDDFDDDDEEEEEEEMGPFAEYASTVGNRFLIGINSLITFPADPVMSTVEPDSEFDELPLAVVSKWPVGFVQGSMLMFYRASTGLLDFTFAVFTPMAMLSPEPRYLLFPNAEHDEY